MNACDATKVYIQRLDNGCWPTLYRKCHSHNTPGKRHNNTVKFRRFLFIRCREGVDNAPSNQGSGCFRDFPIGQNKKKLGRGRRDLDPYQVVFNSIQWLQRRRRKYLGKSETMATILVFRSAHQKKIGWGCWVLASIKVLLKRHRAMHKSLERVSKCTFNKYIITIYIYCPVSRETWRFVPPRKFLSPEGEARVWHEFSGWDKSSCLPTNWAINFYYTESWSTSLYSAERCPWDTTGRHDDLFSLQVTSLDQSYFFTRHIN